MITFLSVLLCATTMVNSWVLAKGKLFVVYLLGILIGGGYTVLNCLLAFRGELGLLLLVVPSVWAVIMSVTGLRRVLRETRRA